MRYLAVAHQTSESPQFVAAVTDLARDDPEAEFVLLVPATPTEQMYTWTEGAAQAVARQRADAAALVLTDAGAKVVATRIGAAHPYEAVIDALNADSYDAVIVSTFGAGASRWLKMDLVNRLRRSLDLPITHVVAD